MNICFNGQLRNVQDPDLPESFINPLNHLHKSVFETFKISNGVLPAELAQHWERLFASAQILELEILYPLNEPVLQQGLTALVAGLDFSQNYRVKVLVHINWWAITVTTLAALPLEIYTEGVIVDDAQEERMFSAAKWSSPLYQQYFAQQKQAGVFETLFFSSDDHLLEGNITNVIAVINGVLVSPADNVLAGVTVRNVLAAAAKQGLPVAFKNITRGELQSATEIFLTNAIKGVVPVKKWQDWQVHSYDIYNKIKNC